MNEVIVVWCLQSYGWYDGKHIEEGGGDFGRNWSDLRRFMWFVYTVVDEGDSCGWYSTTVLNMKLIFHSSCVQYVSKCFIRRTNGGYEIYKAFPSLSTIIFTHGV